MYYTKPRLKIEQKYDVSTDVRATTGHRSPLLDLVGMLEVAPRDAP